ncbi:MAG: hypothetical protein M3Q03_07570, partial [Chloroflexota bacterium]|nr:hypothetical protein [Chloroflexota bacterium]
MPRFWYPAVAAARSVGFALPVRRTMGVAILLLLSLLAGTAAIPAPPAAANHTAIKMPFASGAAWTVGQGYNTSPTEGGTHYNCDPATLTDQPSHAVSCRAHYQYKWSMDLARADGSTAGQAALSPVNGVIRWIDTAFGGMSIDLGDGYAYAYFHTDLAAGLAAGQAVKQGQYLGTVSPPGGGGNGGWPHLHVALWQTSDGGNWSRNAVPFTDDHRMDGYDFPSLGESVRNQHRAQTIYSTNVQVGSSTPPAAPVLTGPANGTHLTGTGPKATLTWNAVSGATEYQVLINDGAITSPWQTGTSWTTPSLADGSIAWQVRARNTAGTGPASPKWIIFINSSETTPTPTPTPAPPATPAATTTPGSLGVVLNPTSGGVTRSVTVSGSGYAAGETIRLHWDNTSTALTSTKADGSGGWSVPITIPNAVRGNHAVIAVGATSGRQTQASFAVVPTLARTPINGVPGTSVLVTTRGFGANESVKLTWKTESGVILGTARTDGTGTGSATVAIPEAPLGWHDYTGLGLTSGARAWGNMGVDPLFSATPTNPSAGATVSAGVKGFPASQGVTFAWNKTSTSAGTTVCSGTVDTNGSFACSFSVPGGAGSYPLVATAANGIMRTVTIDVTGAAAVTVAPRTGQVGTNLTVTVGGFAADETVNLSWDGSSTTWQAKVTSSSGSFTVTTTVPYLPYGAHILHARGASSGRTASTPFNVLATISVSPAGGAVGSSATVYARGFPAGQAIGVAWNKTSTSAGTTVCSGTVGSSGGFTCSFAVPMGTNGTTYPIVATSSAVTASAGYQISSGGTGSSTGTPVSGGTMLGPGTFRVTGTREGLVGGTTSNGHVIVPDDHFIALPACTSSSCPWLTPGTIHSLWGKRVECGPDCFVRVTNPSTGACAVAPVWDVGPWYTNDDWWNPTEARRLNNLDTTVNILSQGYTGADASRNGLDTGYGIAPSGIGISNKGYEVGNRSAIDLADGVWTDLGFDFNAGIAHDGVIVTFLWLSGENPSTAAAACGGSTNLNDPSSTATPTATPTKTPTPTPTATATPTGSASLTLATASGGVGSPTTLSGTGFAPGETVRLFWDATTTPSLT